MRLDRPFKAVSRRIFIFYMISFLKMMLLQSDAGTHGPVSRRLEESAGERGVQIFSKQMRRLLKSPHV